MTGYASGFESLEREVTDERLPVEGSFPAWLDGSLYRNGPAKFEVGGERVAHWFDGLAMVHRYAFDDGAVRYTNRFLRGETYEAAREGRRSASEFASGGSYLDRLRSLVSGTVTDNANVHVVRLGGELVAVTETPTGLVLDPETLATRGRYGYDDDVPNQHASAHHRHDPDRGETVGTVTQFGPTAAYHVYRQADGSDERERIARVSVDRPAYLHSFALARDHVVLTEPPFVANPLDFLRPSTEGFIDAFRWRPERGTRFLVLDRERGAVVADRTVSPFFVFHHVNAFADGRDLVVDLVAYDDPAVVDDLSLSSVAVDPDVPDGRLRRYRIPLGGGDVSRETLYEGLELPRIAPDARTAAYGYAYGQSTDHEGANGLAKVDVRTGDAAEFVESGTYAEEPVFVPRPDGEREDDGVVLATALDADAGRTELLCLDAETFDPRGRARLPHAVPFGFHGRYFRAL
jgi:carotenoid cleavage dioxygenase-like enzyme